ncbi:hypothetical protein K435DRAFT_771891 [Dendrothele bispora CBS 962.96]|uniref:DUF4050 domain-containing protein n=1 Tax=Dendrothele bispora (strain CBS 962.96) TaxID=1314807 RepID=A0A4S8MYV9_DENBC|nr:hypothetical protein K435DRAFT_771891 [Dendrothele bispora CBS 962.96]
MQHHDLSSSPSFSSSSSSSSFDELLQSSTLPPPGPEHYAARRALWLSVNTAGPKSSTKPSTSHQKLEKLLNTPNAIYNDQVWVGGVRKVWSGLSGGSALKKPLPMNLVIKIIHSAWIRDDTWPTGAIAPEPDDVLPD